MSTNEDKPSLDLGEIAPDVDAIVAGARQLLAAGADQLTDYVTRPYFEDFYRVVLKWMATGDHDHIRELLEKLQVALASSDLFSRLSDTDPRVRLALQFHAAGQFLSTFLRTSNLTRAVGLLAGARKQSWREALVLATVRKQPLAVHDFVAAKVFENEKTAHSALKRLVELGFLARNQHGGSVVYELTWPGYAASETFTDVVVTEPEPAPAPNVVPFPKTTWVSDEELMEYASEQLRREGSIIAEKAIQYGAGILPGAYLTSGIRLLRPDQRNRLSACGVSVPAKESGMPNVFRAAWLDRVTNIATRTLTRYAEKTGGGNVLPRDLKAQQHHYEFIANYIASGHATLPQEILFRDDLRPYIDVAELYLVTHMRAVFVRGGEAEEVAPAGENDPASSNFLARVDDSDVELCAPFNTAAHHYLWLAATENRIKRPVEPEYSTVGMTNWLQADPKQRILLCDTGIAADVQQFWQQQGLPGELVIDSRVPYPRPLPAGIAYSHVDPVWGQTVQNIVAHVQASSESVIRDSWEATNMLAAGLDMAPAA